MIVLMVVAAIADGVTFALLPRGAEANPLIVAMLTVSPWVALLSKLALVSFLVAAWGFGAITNVMSWR